MELEKVISMIDKQAKLNAPIGGSLKFELDLGTIYLDGKGAENIVSTENKEADCTITTTIETLRKLQQGDLNPMMAVMTGKVKIKGDMSLAMKLQSLL
jgi:putative sterol carrier protein